ETSGDVSEGAGGGDGGAAGVGGGLERGADDVRAGERPSGERRDSGEGGGDRRGAGKLRGRDERRGRGGSVAAGTRAPEGGQCGRAAEKQSGKGRGRGVGVPAVGGVGEDCAGAVCGGGCGGGAGEVNCGGPRPQPRNLKRASIPLTFRAAKQTEAAIAAVNGRYRHISSVLLGPRCQRDRR